MANKSKISDKHLRYSKVFLDFANAKTSDEAGIKYIDNIKKAFNFPDKIPFPLYPDFDIPSEKDKFPTIIQFQDDIGRLKKNMAQVFDQIKMEWTTKHGDIFDSLEPLNDEGVTELKDLELTDKLMTPKINVLISKSPERDQKTIKDMARHYFRNLLPEHNYILDIRKNLKICLDSIIEHKASGDHDNRFALAFHYYFSETYNNIKTLDINAYYDEEGYFIVGRNPMFNAGFFLAHSEITPLHFGKYYSEPIAFCFIEFLMELNNQKYLRKCKYCKDFFLGEDSRRQFCYEPKPCKKKFYYEDMPRRMREDYRNKDSLKFKVDYLR